MSKEHKQKKLKFLSFVKSKIIAFFQGIKKGWKFFYDIFKSFFEDDCYDKASALSFYSLLSVVPVLAVLFGIAKGLGFGKKLEAEISQEFFQQTIISQKLIEFAHSWLESVKGNVIAGAGIIFLLYTVINLLNCVENIFNEIWKVKEGRSYLTKIRDYLTVFMVAPLFLVTSSSLNIYVTTQIAEKAKTNSLVEVISPFLYFIINFFPFFLMWALFTFIYSFMPNRKIYFHVAAISGIVAGSAFQIWQWLYIKLQFYLTSYSAIYGSFAAFPLFLMWLQVSWLIVLFGVEMGVEIENGLFIQSRKMQSLSTKTAALLIVYYCLENFIKGDKPSTQPQLARKLGISLFHLNKVLEILLKNRILSEASFGDNTLGYQPAHSVNDITYQMVSSAVDQSYDIQVSAEETSELKKIMNLIKEIENASKSKSQKPLYLAVE